MFGKQGDMKLPVKLRNLISPRPRTVLPSLLLAVTLSSAMDDKYLVYIGTYTSQGSEGIYAFHFDAKSGESTSLNLAAPTKNPSFLAVDSRGSFLYAVNELETFHEKPTGAVSTFAIDRVSGKLRLLQQVASLGSGPAHLSLDRSGRYLLVANYGSGSVAVFPISSNGTLLPATSLQQHTGSSVNKERQEGPHAHFIEATADDRFVMSADLGTDQLLVYRFDAAKGTLTPNKLAFAKVTPGSGPRHFAIAPSGLFVYLANEMAATVTVFGFDQGSGKLREAQTVSTLPTDFSGKNKEAEIALDPKGRFLYVSNRGDDSIVVFAVSTADGKLSFVERVPSGGRTPRNFAIDPTGRWLLAANQDSNNLQLFGIDPESGRLKAVSRITNIVSPVCVVFIPVK